MPTGANVLSKSLRPAAGGAGSSAGAHKSADDLLSDPTNIESPLEYNSSITAQDERSKRSTSALPPLLWMTPTSSSSSSSATLNVPLSAITAQPSSSTRALFAQSPVFPTESKSSIITDIFSDDLFQPPKVTSEATSSFTSPRVSESPDLNTGPLSDNPEELAKEDPLATQVWKMFARTKATLPDDQRMKNITWRMMALTLKKKKEEADATKSPPPKVTSEPTSSFTSPRVSESPDLSTGPLSDNPEELAKEDLLATQVWKMFARTKATLPDDQRLENTFRRMMALALKKKKEEVDVTKSPNTDIQDKPWAENAATPSEKPQASSVKIEPVESEERGRRVDKGKTSVRVVDFDGTNQDSRYFGDINGGYTEQDKRRIDRNIEDVEIYYEVYNNDNQGDWKTFLAGGGLATTAFYTGRTTAGVEEPCIPTKNEIAINYPGPQYTLDLVHPVVVSFVVLPLVLMNLFSLVRQRLVASIT
ncbi:hypothetical protein K435DRAFT_843913 [Dendrothele bispora CBS 962.96]|uniref:Nitrogen regulatory protein areA GATA-like domain-containing protein n=1 Tax=Dendrothele bispora (strain CBS 962.96) TaxID=1314807 RepID=A0A4S8L5C9_DENBC|nr:hypothetical protein K435DRAFT_843913 [Dendrothele bispora CBS 962.96]